jgi:hypothetical protein
MTVSATRSAVRRAGERAAAIIWAMDNTFARLWVAEEPECMGMWVGGWSTRALQKAAPPANTPGDLKSQGERPLAPL